MMEQFKEEQRFTQWWMWALISIAPFAILLIVYFASEEVRSKTTEWLLSVIGTCVLLPLVLFLSMRLDTKITPEGIHYRFRPFHLRDRAIPWSEIAKVYLRIYRPIAEYGGWGIKGGFGSGTAYNVKGNLGLQIELKSGKRILLGTQRGTEIEKSLARWWIAANT